jgi:YHS domain-containing protein|tara:strand:- start:669804 stop:670250 length:447 start_codon:yes stop_codon:yes gene_type:complete
MKNYIVYFVLLCSFAIHAQETNTKRGYAAEGYDVVAYFDGQAMEGEKEFTATHKGVKYQFANAKNLQTFQSNPEAFVPQYGGFCAYAVATSGKKVGINPKSFQIKDGKLYLFYDSIFADTLENWNEEGPTLLQTKADENWEKIAMKKN